MIFSSLGGGVSDAKGGGMWFSHPPLFSQIDGYMDIQHQDVDTPPTREKDLNLLLVR